jgi:hypothetical protein
VSARGASVKARGARDDFQQVMIFSSGDYFTVSDDSISR